jgi:hypothetical protein
VSVTNPHQAAPARGRTRRRAVVRGWLAKKAIDSLGGFEPRPFEATGRTFERPHRTLVMRAVNSTGRVLRACGRQRPITTEDVIGGAERTTRLADWGGDEFREPLARLVESLERDAALTPLGRLFLRALLVHFGANRLRLQQLLGHHPEIRHEPIRAPLFIVGLPRTGSTLLYQLLALDPANRPLLGWESFWPATARGGWGSDPAQRERCLRSVLVPLHLVAPQISVIHPMHAAAPDESTLLMGNSFVAWTFSLLGRVRSYDDWLWGVDRGTLEESYRYLKLQLQALQWQRPGGRWLVKSPIHLQSLDALMTVFPDAQVIQSHRDPAEVVPSTSSLFAVLRSVGSDRVEPRELGEEIAGRLALALARATRVRRLMPDRFVDVDYAALVRDPSGTVERLRVRVGSDGTPLSAAVEQWLARRPPPPRHQYDLAQFGLTRERVAELFAAARVGADSFEPPAGRHEPRLTEQSRWTS